MNDEKITRFVRSSDICRYCKSWQSCTMTRTNECFENDHEYFDGRKLYVDGRAALESKGGTDSNELKDETCPHYYESTDGVHVVLVGRCRCGGKIPEPYPNKEKHLRAVEIINALDHAHARAGASKMRFTEAK